MKQKREREKDRERETETEREGERERQREIEGERERERERALYTQTFPPQQYMTKHAVELYLLQNCFNTAKTTMLY